MAIYIEIEKISETNKNVTYKFNSGIRKNEDVGILEINKKTGNCSIIKSMPGDVDNQLAGYAYRGILRHWKKGEFPNKTCFAS